MANQYKNKIIYGNQTLMDITDTTATQEGVVEGQVFYNASGARSTGSLGDATQSTHGLMSATDKIKLDNIERIDPYETINTPAPLIHLTDAAEAPVKKIEIEINPIQDFNGYDRAWIGGIGKNKLPVYTKKDYYPTGIISGFHTYADGHIYITGTSLTDFDAWLIEDGYFLIGEREEIAATFHYSGNYIISGSSTNPPATIQFYNVDTEEIDASGNGQFTLDGDYNIKIHCENNTRYSISIWLMLRLASIADDTFEPYENICPITGYTGIQLRTANKNLFSINFDTFTKNGVTYSSENSYIIMNGTHYGQAIYNFSRQEIYLPAGTYNVDYRLVSGTVIAPEGNTEQIYGNIQIYRSDDNRKLLQKNMNYSTQQTNDTFTLTQGRNIYIAISKRDNTTFTNAKFLLTITRAEDTITNGIPYEGKVYDISFPTTVGTVYGGKLTIHGDESGEVSINKKLYHLTADDNINLASQQISGFNRFHFYGSGNVKYDSTKYLACDKLPKVTSANPGIGIIGQPASNISILSDLSTVEAFKEWLTEIGGLDIVYELGTPITYQLTSPQIQTLLSENNIWANSGNINKLIYGKNINGLINGADKVKLDFLTNPLPPISTLDNNSVLQVQNGGWTVAPLNEMTGATSNTNGTAGLVPAPNMGDQDKFLAGDGTFKSGSLPMVILSYGNSTWSDFINAYNNNVIVYCRASSSSNPASGTQGRMAFMAYVNNATTPTEVEFQYYRSMSSHSATAMGDQVFVYKLNKNNGWSVTTRDASIKQIKVDTNDPGTVSWSGNVVTLKSGLPKVTSADEGKILKVVNGVWTAVSP